jgi:hypothetical protein
VDLQRLFDLAAQGRGFNVPTEVNFAPGKEIIKPITWLRSCAGVPWRFKLVTKVFGEEFSFKIMCRTFNGRASEEQSVRQSSAPYDL